ncbi:hypothetical protein [Oceanobacillus kimchii]|uniref:hypothetical protein n=1 Tax=Oceanobacillus kimchii TaxID=746691 RepID=UPI00098412CD|nr:hypothetical protein [Oceanobacillus kimchii]
MKKMIVVLLEALLIFGGGTYILASSDGTESESSESKGLNGEELEEAIVASKDNESQSKEEEEENEEEKVVEVPEGWEKEEFIKTKESFDDVGSYLGEIDALEDVQREIIQMTSQKIESKQMREIQGGDAPIFPYTPPYPSGAGPFEDPTRYSFFTKDNIKYVKHLIDELDLDEETNKYYHGFLDEWLNDDFSNLIQVHKDLLHEYAEFPRDTERYKEIDDYQLATEEQEKAFLKMYDQ